ncbi:hypothetical protein [Pseudomonas sp. Marseille-Q5299]|uniref:hypothetical protein n=1 Tax=Pseudomonas sp. Marseille-Q5299 TaxID=2942201 RepID=UPI00207464F7|nr:hypothetical protein [Pseudomonas sp. Marseille-Q5299]
MHLTKSCHEKDHIKKRKTVKLATLEHYRRTENHEISDASEGMLQLELNVTAPTIVEHKWLNTIMQGAIHYGSPDATIRFPGVTNMEGENIVIRRHSERHCLLEKAKVSVQRESLNSLIFCMSESLKEGDCREIFKGYDSEWSIPKENAEDMSRILSQALMSRILDDSLQPIIQIPSDKSLKIIYSHMSVLYTDREILINHNNTGDFNKILDHLEFTSFLKPRSYSHEREYRFNFLCVGSGGVIPYINDSVILSVPEDFISLIM